MSKLGKPKKITKEINKAKAKNQSPKSEPKEKNQTTNKFVYPTLSIISTIALVIGVARLSPIAQWTRSQNECIEKTSSEDELKKGAEKAREISVPYMEEIRNAVGIRRLN